MATQYLALQQSVSYNPDTNTTYYGTPVLDNGRYVYAPDSTGRRAEMIFIMPSSGFIPTVGSVGYESFFAFEEIDGKIYGKRYIVEDVVPASPIANVVESRLKNINGELDEMFNNTTALEIAEANDPAKYSSWLGTILGTTGAEDPRYYGKWSYGLVVVFFVLASVTMITLTGLMLHQDGRLSWRTRFTTTGDFPQPIPGSSEVMSAYDNGPGHVWRAAILLVLIEVLPLAIFFITMAITLVSVVWESYSSDQSWGLGTVVRVWFNAPIERDSDAVLEWMMAFVFPAIWIANCIAFGERVQIAIIANLFLGFMTSIGSILADMAGSYTIEEALTVRKLVTNPLASTLTIARRFSQHSLVSVAFGLSFAYSLQAWYLAEEANRPGWHIGYFVVLVIVDFILRLVMPLIYHSVYLAGLVVPYLRIDGENAYYEEYDGLVVVKKWPRIFYNDIRWIMFILILIFVPSMYRWADSGPDGHGYNFMPRYNQTF